MLVSRIITFVYLIATNGLTITTVNIILPTSKQTEVSTMDDLDKALNKTTQIQIDQLKEVIRIIDSGTVEDDSIEALKEMLSGQIDIKQSMINGNS